MKCDNCKHHLKGGETCDLCYCYDRYEPKDYPPYLDHPKQRKPVTNYDRIISKTPEEMADILVEHGFVLEWYCGKDEIKSVVYQPKDEKNKLIDWLKQEATDAK